MSRMMIFYVPDVEPRTNLRAKARIIAPKGGKPFASFYDPAKNKEHKAILSASFQGTMGFDPMFDGPVSMSLVLGFSRPKSLAKSVAEHVKKPDIDNCTKMVMDSMNGIVWNDDRQVVSMCVDKIYTPDVPFTYVEVCDHTFGEQACITHVREALAR